jgi:hypothetical protein
MDLVSSHDVLSSGLFVSRHAMKESAIKTASKNALIGNRDF